MTHRRASIRAAVQTALWSAPHFAGFERISAWASSVDAESLPVIGVATPSEAKVQDAHRSAERTITTIVVLKRRGGDDIEDILDEDSDLVEHLVLGAVRTLDMDIEMDRADVTVDGSAEKRIGTLTMSFRAFVQTPEPLTP